MKEILLNTVRTKSPNYKKYSALVDDEDFDRVNQYKWYVSIFQNVVYAVAMIKGKNVKMHKFITGYSMSDHINRNGLDNQKHNLREATKSQNGMNCQSSKNSASAYKGVTWSKANSKWQAQITKDNKPIYLGYFHNESNAALAYNEAAKKYHGEFAYLNNILKKETV